jgi:hypothetical protein
MTARRNLIILGAAALISIVLAIIVVVERAAEGQSHFAPTEFLPGLAANVKNAATIYVAGHNSEFDIAFSGGKWVLPGHGNYPADFDQVRHTLIGLAALQTIAPKTDRADWQHYVNLDAPPQGNGDEFIIKDASGKVLASLITGTTEQLGDPNGTIGLFVRHTGDNQTYLARSVFTPAADLLSWINASVIDLGAARIQQVTVTPPKGTGFTVTRAKDSDLKFNLASPPKTGNPNQQMLDAIPYAVSSFSLEDVQPVASVDFTAASHAVGKGFDGLVITVDIAPKGKDLWGRLTASTAPGASPDAVKDAAGINAKAGGWAYKIPAEKGKALIADLATIMTPMQQPAGPDQGGMPGMPPGMTMPPAPGMDMGAGAAP